MLQYRIQVAKLISQALAKIGKTLSAEDARSLLNTPPNSKMGDIAFPCFTLAKELRQAPPALSQQIVSQLPADLSEFGFSKAIVAGPYVNFFIDHNKIVAETFTAADLCAQKQIPFGKSDIGSGKRIVLEYSSPNIAKPMHVGHMRVTIVGAALNRIYRHAGFTVESINHIGDWGTQFGKLIVAFKNWGSETELKEHAIAHLVNVYVKFHKECETNPALEDEARATFKKLEDGDPEIRALWKRFTDLSYLEFQKTYDRLHATFDHILGESFYEDKMAAVIADLKQKNLLVESEGAQVVNLEAFNLIPMIVIKSDGSTIYATRDLAAAIYRAKTWPFEKMIYVVGAQQELHFRQFFKTLEVMGFAWAKDCVHVKTGWFTFQGKGISTRKGEVVLLGDVIDAAVTRAKEVIAEKMAELPNKDEVAEQIGVGATLFAELSTDPAKDVNFDFDRVLDFAGETGPYLQYTYARSCSVLRKASEQNLKAELKTDLLMEDELVDLAKHLASFEDVLQKAVSDNKPTPIASFLIDLAKKFNVFYLNHQVLKAESAELVASRLAVVRLFNHALKSGLDLLGIAAPERM